MPMSPDQIAKTLINESFHSRRLVVALFVLVNAALLTVALLFPKGFSASTTILIDDRNIVQPLMQGAAVATEVTDRGRNAREVIFGRKIMDRILEDGGWLINRPSAEEQERIIEAIKKRTTITTVGRNIIKIDYRDDDAERVFRVTQKFAELFIQESIAAKGAESSAAFDFIEKQTQEYHDKLTRTEEQLRDLRSANLDVGASSEAEVTARMNELQTRIERTMQELREAEIKGQSLERQVSGEVEVTAAATREGQYRARIADLQSRLDTLRLSYHDTHPDIVQLKQQIQDLMDDITAERERREQMKRAGRVEPEQSAMNNPVYQQLRRELSQNQLNVEALKARIADSQQRLQQEMGRGRLLHSGDARLAELTRDYQVNRDIYQDLLRRRENARVSMNLDRERQGLTFKVQEPATLPLYPSGLRFWHFVAGGLLLGVAIPVGVLFARLHVDPRIRIGSAISDTHKVPVAAVIPHMWTPRELGGLRWELVLLTLAVVATVAVSAGLTVLRLTKVL
ncbi:MAG: XrtA system polysaccharide chain length determinant [Burkholderiales bacterium]